MFSSYNQHLVATPLKSYRIASLNNHPNQKPELNWGTLLSHVPDLSKDFYSNLLTRRPIVMAVRSVARLLATTLDPSILSMLDIATDFSQTHSKTLGAIENKSDVLGSEISPAHCKLSFLTLVKASLSA